jgi:hypothetical protein
MDLGARGPVASRQEFDENHANKGRAPEVATGGEGIRAGAEKGSR